jgi:hypothetical protein
MLPEGSSFRKPRLNLALMLAQPELHCLIILAPAAGLKSWFRVLINETANSSNAIRADLAGFEQADSQPFAAEHREQVERALERIEAAVEKAVEQTTPQPGSGSQPTSDAPRSKAA